MAIGDVEPVPGCSDLSYLDTGMYDVAGYGSVYLLDAERPAVVDAGIGADREAVFDAVDEHLDGHLEEILLTHVHLDHAGGAGYLADRYPEATVRAHEVGVPHLVDPDRLVAGTKEAVGDQWRFYDDPVPIPEDRIDPLADGDAIDLGDRTLAVHRAPGHAPHQVAFHDRRDDVVFTGDAAGIWVRWAGDVYPTSPPPQFDLEECLDDVRHLEDLDPDGVCFGHFGPVTDDVAGVLETYKRTLIEWVEAVRQRRAALDGDEAVIEAFASSPDPDLVEVWGRRKASDELRLNAAGVLRYLDRVED